jgi:hypothetical protein
MEYFQEQVKYSVLEQICVGLTMEVGEPDRLKKEVMTSRKDNCDVSRKDVRF